MRKIMYRYITMIVVITLLVSCAPKGEQEETSEYERYRGSFFDTFDTVVTVVGFTETEEEFQGYMDTIEQRFQQLHKLYDKYNDYEGINNIKTINDHAGKEPVKVNKEIIDLIKFSKEWYEKSLGKTNIAMGSVLEIWHDYRERGEYDPLNAEIPPMEMLQEAAKHMDINNVIVDEQNSTVYLADEKMRLDVGGVAKGYATELVAQEMMAAGFESVIISAGGNVRAVGKPLDGVRKRWGVGIQNPDKFVALDEENLLDTVFVNNLSVVSSGDYQRYYIVDGQLYHHIIDPDTLMPESYYRAVTVVTENSGLADFLSKPVFLLPLEESRAFVESIDGMEALWVLPDGTIEATDGLQKIMKSHGASATDAE